MSLPIFLLLYAAGQPADAPPPVDRVAPIVGVTVFEDRAEVVREGRHGCEGGFASVVLEPLPLSIRQDALRAQLERGRLIGLRARPVRRPAPEAVAAAEAEVFALREALRTRLDDAAAAREGLELVARYGELGAREAKEALRAARPGLRAAKAEIDAVHARRLELGEVARAAEAEAERLKSEAQEANAALARARGAREGLSVELRVACEGPGGYALVYETPFASWRPEYDLRVPGEAPPASGEGGARFELDVAAAVRQQTGEDWSGVRLTLSTARPRLAAEAPRPAPFRLGAREKSEAKVLVQARERRPSLERGGSAEGPGPRDARLREEGQVATLVVPHEVSMKSDGRERFVPVDALRGRDAIVRLVAVPSQSRAVHREVEIVSPARYPLLPGVVRVYRGGALVGQAALGLVAPGAKARLPLGTDARFEVLREDLEDLEDVRGLFAKSRVLERALRTTIRSEAKRPAAIEVRQQIPVSRSEEIRVALDRARSTRGLSLDATRGHVFWTLEPPPGGEAEVDLVYRVELPEDWVVPE